ncbi:aldo/keto reductase [Microbacterium terrisoli]|uniref:aldo/keto reductase n=1 Tax=Microbacterium terrisoli TaxID=3242192 RepID=UPI0028056384|nr:aldo/keto reductase [Microbacterium protaetiae]
MRARAVGREVMLTRIGLGVAQFGNLYRETTDEEAAGAFQAAWDGGVRYFDTAPHYGLGLSERRLGRLLRDRRRDSYALSTKVGRLLEPNPDGQGRMDDEGFVVPATLRRRLDYSADGVKRSLESSLTRLGVDRIDIVYIHDPDEHWRDASELAVPALVELRDQGVIGAVGVGMNQSAMLAEFVRRCDVDVVMLAGRYTLLDQRAQSDLLPLALQRGVGVVAAGVYNSGLLARDRPSADAHYEYETAGAELVDRATRIAELCEQHGCTLPEAAIAFPLRHPAVVSAVLGARNARQSQTNIARSQAVVPDALWAALADSGLVPEAALTLGDK